MWLVLLGLVACRPSAVVELPTGPASANPAGPNLLLITVDTLRADHLGAYGYARATSPGIDAVARTGAVYERVYASRGATWPSLTTLMTSLDPVDHGVRDNSTHVSNAPTTLAEVLSARGYQTHAWLTNAASAHWEGFADVQPVGDEPLDAVAATRAAHWLGERQRSPWFVWVHLTAPHDPYTDHPEIISFADPAYAGPVSDAPGSQVATMFRPQVPADRAALVDRYDSEVAAADAAIGRILDSLRAAHLSSTTLVVISADHGEELADHPPFLYHFGSPWDSVLRVPLVIRQDGVIPVGKRVDAPIGLIDLAPTLLDLLHVERPAAWRGVTAAPLLFDRPMPPRRIVSELVDRALIVHEDRWARLWNPTGYAPDLATPLQLEQSGVDAAAAPLKWSLPRAGLYDVVADPLQTRDLSADHPDVAARLDASILAYKEATGWPRWQAQPVSSDVRKQLEALGYTSGAK